MESEERCAIDRSVRGTCVERASSRTRVFRKTNISRRARFFSQAVKSVIVIGNFNERHADPRVSCQPRTRSSTQTLASFTERFSLSSLVTTRPFPLLSSDFCGARRCFTVRSFIATWLRAQRLDQLARFLLSINSRVSPVNLKRARQFDGPKHYEYFGGSEAKIHL